jgi:uncharacterized protein
MILLSSIPKHSRQWLGNVLLLLWLWLAGLAFAEPALPAKPTQFVTDAAGVLPKQMIDGLNRQLEAFELATSNQILVAIYPKLPEGTFLEDYTVKTARAWGAGDKQRDNGIILFAFISDRKMRIEVGYGLEGAVPDSIAASIIRDEIRPHFKAGDYAGGVQAAVDALQKATKGEYKGTGKANHTSGDFPFWLVILGVIAFLIWVHSGDTVLQRAGRDIVWGVAQGIFSGSSGSGHSSHSDGGGWSGGGGDFGGGGASGDW